MLPFVTAKRGPPVETTLTAPPKMLPPVKPTSEPGVRVVVKLRSIISALTALLFSAAMIQLDVWDGDDPVRVEKELKAGKVMSTAVTAPLVTSTASVPEKAQLSQFWPAKAIAEPETSNVVIVSA